MVMVANMVIECPDGKLLLPVSVLPIITKLSWSYTAAGRGIVKIFLSIFDKMAEIRDAAIKSSQILGAYMMKIVSKDMITKVSPNWVRLCSNPGNCDHSWLIS